MALKPLSLKYTPFGDYEKPMYDWMDQATKEQTAFLMQVSFTVGVMIPFDVMKTYAAMDALCTFLLYEKV